MSLFGRKEKQEIERLKSQMNPQQIEAADLEGKIQEASKQLEKLEKEIQKKNDEIQRKNNDLANLKKQIIETDEAITLQSFGIYTPHYCYSTSDEYKEKLQEVRNKQKQLVKNDNAATASTDWTVNGSKAEGKKMIKSMQKLLLRAFNAECDDAIEHVRFNNIDSCEKKIHSSAEAISKLGTTMKIAITSQYMNLKIEELRLMHEYQQKKQDEKEAAKEARQRQREEAKVLKELEEARKNLTKEQQHYENALKKINRQLQNARTDQEKADLEEKKLQLETQIQTISSELEQVDYRAANQRAGYVYVISNIGAFGEGVYKIGMTRRLDPMDRVNELGDASVPFNFDVHAMIFTEDAPGLEAALHNAFADRKLNYINQRREFFRVDLDEIKKVIRENYDKTVEFIDIAPAEQYRKSLLLQAERNK